MLSMKERVVGFVIGTIAVLGLGFVFLILPQILFGLRG